MSLQWGKEYVRMGRGRVGGEKRGGRGEADRMLQFTAISHVSLYWIIPSYFCLFVCFAGLFVLAHTGVMTTSSSLLMCDQSW